eukprot:comp22739_c0_seq1/m.35444 comp22739_c0_seq1/g.35444  ORF comp22739_c0_seq1/g.35444 comp22739_c0_seq1/m.35444 type:complete len:727 (-) comp22739_c0_seq1:461-2641(-)
MPIQNGGPIAALRTQPNMASGLPKPTTTVKPALHRIEQARVMARHRETEAMFRSTWTPDASLDIVADILLRIWAWTDEDTNTFLGTFQTNHSNQSDFDDLLDTDAGLGLGVMADWSDRSQSSRADRENRAKSQVRLWVFRTIRDMECCHSVVVGALIFVYRLRHTFAKETKPPLPRKHLFLMCLLMSSKMLYDVPYTNGQWADVCNIPVKEFNRMEHTVLAALNFNVEIEPELHRKTAIYLDEISGGPLYGGAAARRVSKNVSRRETAERAPWAPTQATTMAAMRSTLPNYPTRPVPPPRPVPPQRPNIPTSKSNIPTPKSTSCTTTENPAVDAAMPSVAPAAPPPAAPPTFTSVPALSRNPKKTHEEKTQSGQQVYHSSKVRAPARAMAAAIQLRGTVTEEGETDEAEYSANQTAQKVAQIGKSVSADRLPIRSTAGSSSNHATQSLVANLVSRVVQAQRTTKSDSIDQIQSRNSARSESIEHIELRNSAKSKSVDQMQSRGFMMDRERVRQSEVNNKGTEAPAQNGGLNFVMSGFKGNRETGEKTEDSLRKTQIEDRRQHQYHGGSLKTNMQSLPVSIKHAAETALRQGATLRVNGFSNQSNPLTTQNSTNRAFSRSTGVSPNKETTSRPITPIERSPGESDLPKPMETSVTFRSVPQRPAEAAKRVQMEVPSGSLRSALIGQIQQASTWESVMSIVLKGPAACLGAPTLPPPSAKASNANDEI